MRGPVSTSSLTRMLPVTSEVSATRTSSRSISTAGASEPRWARRRRCKAVRPVKRFRSTSARATARPVIWLRRSTATLRTISGSTISRATTSTPRTAAESTSVRRRNRATAWIVTRCAIVWTSRRHPMAKELVIDLAIRYGFQVLGALVILAVGAILGRWLGGLVDQRLRARAMEPPMRLLITRVLRIVVTLFAGVVARDKFGFQIAPLVAGIGVAGLGIGIALQGVLSNVVAGLTIIFTKPFRVGEYIEIAGVNGDVAAIELFSTTLVHTDRSRIIVPNRKIVGEILHNFGTVRQLHLALVVPHASDLTGVLAVAHDVVTANRRVLDDPAPVIGITQIEAAGIRIGVNPWVRVADVSDAEAELYKALAERFRAAGIDAPPLRHEVRVLDAPSAATARLA